MSRSGEPNHLAPPPTELSAAFLTHAAYIRAFALVAGRPPRTDGWSQAFVGLRDRWLGGGAASGTPPGDEVVEQVHARLRHAWGTSLLISLTARHADEDELVRVSNNWTVVQLYYVLYHSTQALLLATGQPRPDSHPKTQKQFATLWCSRSRPLAPWSLCVGPQNVVQNLPAGSTVETDIHAWTSCNAGNALSFCAKALRTTRDRLLQERLVETRESRRSALRRDFTVKERARVAMGRSARPVPSFPLPRLQADDRLNVDVSLGACALIHYLYRLRIRSNYEDSTMFTDGPSTAPQSLAVRRDLEYLAQASLFVAELEIGRRVGSKPLATTMLAWSKANSSGEEDGGLRARAAVIYPAQTAATRAASSAGAPGGSGGR